jgi:general secretion pathway protein D
MRLPSSPPALAAPGASRRRCAVAIALLLSLAGCATAPEIDQSRDLAAQGRDREALARLEQGARRAPDDLELRAALARQRELTLARLLATGDAARAARETAAAEQAFREALAIDAANPRARAGLEALARDARHEARLAEAQRAADGGRVAEAETILRSVLLENSSHTASRRLLQRLREQQLSAELQPRRLRLELGKPITLEVRDLPLRNVFDVIARTAGVNFVFDREVRPDTRVTIQIRDSPVEDVIRLVLAANALERKVLNDNSLLIYPNTPAKAREYQELSVRAFYLANADVKQAQAMLSRLVKTRDIHVDEKLNLIAIRDTPAAIRLAERLIESIDLAEPEVMLEVEVLEISRSRLQQIGINFPTSVAVEATLPLSPTVPPGRIDLRALDDSRLTATIASPALRLNLLAQDASVDLLANPRIRVKNREKARVLIGEKLPVFTTTAVPTAGVAVSVSYLDVGLRLDVEPTVHLEDEVAIRVLLEVNSTLERVTGPDGSTAFRLGTRTAQTHLRLRDGETQVLAGLINESERENIGRLPGLGDLPGIGRLFSSLGLQRDKSEIVLLITPRILRNLQPPPAETMLMTSGTELAPGAAPLAIAPTRPGGLALRVDEGRGAARPAATAEPDVAPVAAVAAPGAATAAPQLRLRAPQRVSLGTSFEVEVEVDGAGDATDGVAEIAFTPGLLQAAGGTPGRVSVPLARRGASLAGSVSLRALAAGAGSASVEAVGGSMRRADGGKAPLPAGAAVTIGVGL